MSAFEELGVCPEIIQAVEEAGWLLPTPVQAESIPLILGGGDVCAASETGSGKTAAFGLGAIQIVQEDKKGVAGLDVRSQGMCSALDPGLKVGADLTLSLEGGAGSEFQGCRFSKVCSSASWAFEVEVIKSGSSTGGFRVGWACPCAKLELGVDDMSFGICRSGQKVWHSKFDRYAPAPVEEGEVITSVVDWATREVSTPLLLIL